MEHFVCIFTQQLDVEGNFPFFHQFFLPFLREKSRKLDREKLEIQIKRFSLGRGESWGELELNGVDCIYLIPFKTTS
jgi:hypothetical protein